ncbi:Mnd1 family protein [Trifolium repens]|nr:Mnd1 family protein [Trifolium repens]KAK2420537.1 Mnd1 family protein [Trifolium repens]
MSFAPSTMNFSLCRFIETVSSLPPLCLSLHGQELEKMGPKKGVITQSVKDVVQSLVDEDLVSKDKIGTSVYFWSLPSCAGNQHRNHAQLVEQCEALKKGHEESDEREAALADLKAIQLKHNELKSELEKSRDNDPAAFEAMKEAIEVAHASANRWTDNIFTLKQWCSNNFPQAKEQLQNIRRRSRLFDPVGDGSVDFGYICCGADGLVTSLATDMAATLVVASRRVSIQLQVWLMAWLSHVFLVFVVVSLLFPLSFVTYPLKNFWR